MRELLTENRLVTLTGAGGAGKTRLAIQIAGQLSGEFGDGVWYVDLAPITDPELVPLTVARAFGLPDQPGRSTMDTLTRFVADRQMLVVLDNCEHLLDASAALVDALLGAAAGLTLLATSREPIGVAGEVSWRVPSLSLADEAIELFTDRARRARPDFTVSDDNAATVAEICARLDGLPLAIELAAARVRALSLAEILDSLHDRFRLLTGGARTAVRRQQTLRASVDWSHALLTEPERVLFRRLAAFLGGFDLDAAQTVAGGGEVERYQVLDQLTLLVDKSLVVADDSRGRTRYRLLETVRQYALEKLGESGEADAVRARHRDHYTAMAAAARRAGRQLITSSASSRPTSRSTTCAPRSRGAGKTPTSSWRWRWRRRCSRCGTRGAASGKGWPGSTPPSPTSTRSTSRWRPRCGRGRSPTGPCSASGWAPPTAWIRLSRPWRSPASVDDPALLARALTACGFIASGYQRRGGPGVLRRGDRPGPGVGRPVAAQPDPRRAGAGRQSSRVTRSRARAAAEEGRDLADAIGDRFDSRRCRCCLGGHSYIRAIWPEPPHNSARWPPRPRRLTMSS